MRSQRIGIVLNRQFAVHFVAVVILAFSFYASNSIYSPLFAQDSQPEASTKRVYLPLVSRSVDQIKESAEEAALANLMKNQPGQQHPVLNFNSILAKEARRKAKDMADRLYFDHVDPDGYGPNYWVLKAGYVLPPYYGTENDANNIESIGAGHADFNDVWKAFMESSGHRKHLLGEHPFYQEQYEYGIGHFYKKNGSFEHYWVILIAKPG